MKKAFFLWLALFNFSLAIAQQGSDSQELYVRKNELTINPIFLLVIPNINISYERLINSDFGLGIDAMLTLNSKISVKSQFSPYGRMYFGKKYASGFFIETFLPITTADKNSGFNYTEETNSSSKDKDVRTHVGIGFGVGVKRLVKRNLLFQTSLGLGRLFGNFNNEVTPFSIKFMLGMGYRF